MHSHTLDMLQDLRYAIRLLRGSPLFTTVVVLSLALGIGANTALFSLMDQLLWRSLPVKSAEQIFFIQDPRPAGRSYGSGLFSYPAYRNFRDSNHVFDGLIAQFTTTASVLWQNQARTANIEIVSGNYFDVLGVKVPRGRSFTAEEDRTPLTHPVAVISYSYWMRRFGSDPRIIGSQININTKPFTVIGVADAGFQSLEVGRSPDVFVPMMMKPWITPDWNGMEERIAKWILIAGRMKPGITPEQASAQLTANWKSELEEDIKNLPGISAPARQRQLSKIVQVIPGARGVSTLRSRFQSPLFILLAMVGALLLIACVNVANLLLARASGRQKEIAVRLSMGASRARLLRQLMVESILLSLLGGLAGLIVAAWSGSLLLRFLPDAQQVRSLSLDYDYRILLFTLALSLFTGLLFGLVPAMQTIHPDLITSLKEQGRNSSATRSNARWRRGLVVVQVSLCLILVFGAGLFSQSLINLRHINPGFRAENLTVFTVDPTLAGYGVKDTLPILERLRTELRNLPEATHIAMGGNIPLSGDIFQVTTNVEGYQSKDGENMSTLFDFVGPDYFATLGVQVVLGRPISQEDVSGKRNVALVNQKFANYFFGRTNPIGRRIGFGLDQPKTEIIGVVADSYYTSLREEIARKIYVPVTHALSTPSTVFFVRSRMLPPHWTESIRAALNRVDPRLPIADMKTMEVQISESYYLERMISAVAGFFGSTATLLAAIGLYGVIAFRVAQRTREIAIRIALGAQPNVVLRSVLTEVLALTTMGVFLGLPAAAILSRYTQSQLFGVKAADPWILATATLLLGVIMLLAGFLPARRAMHIQPVKALHDE